MNKQQLEVYHATSRVYVLAWTALLILTAVTVAVATLHLTHYAVVSAILIATAKAGVVLTFFMHLKYEPIVLKIMLFLALAAMTFIILLTFSDVWYR